MDVPTSQRRMARVLIRVGTAALLQGRPSESDDIFAAVRVLCPHLPQLDLLPATTMMVAGRYDEAAKLLQYVPGTEAAALMAMCQISLGAPDWQSHAEWLIQQGYLPEDALTGPSKPPSADIECVETGARA